MSTEETKETAATTELVCCTIEPNLLEKLAEEIALVLEEKKNNPTADMKFTPLVAEMLNSKLSGVIDCCVDRKCLHLC